MNMCGIRIPHTIANSPVVVYPRDCYKRTDRSARFPAPTYMSGGIELGDIDPTREKLPDEQARLIFECVPRAKEFIFLKSDSVIIFVSDKVMETNYEWHKEMPAHIGDRIPQILPISLI